MNLKIKFDKIIDFQPGMITYKQSWLKMLILISRSNFYKNYVRTYIYFTCLKCTYKSKYIHKYIVWFRFWAKSLLFTSFIIALHCFALLLNPKPITHHAFILHTYILYSTVHIVVSSVECIGTYMDAYEFNSTQASRDRLWLYYKLQLELVWMKF